jgi:hypothetical protein
VPFRADTFAFVCQRQNMATAIAAKRTWSANPTNMKPVPKIQEANAERTPRARTRRRGACRLRLRPIVMTSVAFIAGTIPLVLSHGAGAEVRSATGVTVFARMIGVTLFGLFLTPVFYVGLRKLSGRKLIQHGEAGLSHG